MLLAQKQEAILELDDEQQDFMEDGLEGFDSDCEDLQLNTTSTFMTDHVDAYDSDCNEAPTAIMIFIARLSPTRSVNGDDAGPFYDTDILYELTNDSNVISDIPYADTNTNEFVQDMNSLAQNDAIILSTVNQETKQVSESVRNSFM
ncbi:hypothetical protein Tco_0318635 [Tanacetum coccineum]